MQASPFEVLYTLGITDTDPSSDDFTEAGDATLAHIDLFLALTFASIPETTYLGKVGLQTSTGVDPVTIDFDFAALFAGNSQSIPDSAELDQLIEQSLSQPAVDSLITELRSLAGNNPFSTTLSVSYSPIEGLRQQTNGVLIDPSQPPFKSLVSPFAYSPSAPSGYQEIMHQPSPSQEISIQSLSPSRAEMPTASDSPTEMNDTSTSTTMSNKENESKRGMGLVLVCVSGIVVGLLGLLAFLWRIHGVATAKPKDTRNPAFLLGSFPMEDESHNLMHSRDESEPPERTHSVYYTRRPPFSRNAMEREERAAYRSYLDYG